VLVIVYLHTILVVLLFGLSVGDGHDERDGRDGHIGPPRERGVLKSTWLVRLVKSGC
jgi:hypothetical protein